MTYIDFHTHHIPSEPDTVAVVCGRDTWGIHPWDIRERGESEILAAPSSFAAEGGLLAIGECGLDALQGPPMETQVDVMKQMVELSEDRQLPLIVHCVKALDPLLRLRRELRPQQPWMLHGFRGKPQQLRSLLDAGFFVGFGFRHNPESLRLCPLDRLMPETDDDRLHPISEIYNNVARERNLSVALLCNAMAENYRTFFRKEPLRT